MESKPPGVPSHLYLPVKLNGRSFAVQTVQLFPFLHSRYHPSDCCLISKFGGGQGKISLYEKPLLFTAVKILGIFYPVKILGICRIWIALH